MALSGRGLATSTLMELSIIMGSAGVYVWLRETNDLFRGLLPLVLILAAFQVFRRNSHLISDED